MINYLKNVDIWDCWNRNDGPICITTNGIVKSGCLLVMGAGLAKQASSRFKTLSHELGFLVKVYGNIPFYFPNYRIISFPTKHNWKDNSDLDLIANSCLYLKQITNVAGIKNVYLSKVGCGLGGLDWEKQVKPLIENKLNDDYVNFNFCV